MKFDRIISAAGIVPNTDNLGLENTKVQLTQSGHIVTDEWMATDEPGVYAIGDITQPPFLAHKASHEAVVCVEKIANYPTHPICKNNIPGCIQKPCNQHSPNTVLQFSTCSSPVKLRANRIKKSSISRFLIS